MSHETDGTLLVQGACLKYLPTTIPHLLRVYSGKQLSTILTDLLVTLPTGRLTKQKMMTVNDIVHSPLFLNVECRAILLPRITILVRDLLEAKEEVRCYKMCYFLMLQFPIIYNLSKLECLHYSYLNFTRNNINSSYLYILAILFIEF